MNTTEESIVYQLLKIIRGAELNSDEVIGERTVRSLMRVQRSDLINMFSKKGILIPDVCFQKLNINKLTSLNTKELIVDLPPIVYLQSNFGLRISTPEFENIPVINNEDYQLSKHNPINKFKPKATIQNQQLKVYVTDASPSALNGGNRSRLINDSLRINKLINISAVLDDPDDGLNYDWTKSEYPFPSEEISTLKKNLLRRDFDIIIKTKSDQVPNAKNDTLRYHDQDDVQR